MLSSEAGKAIVVSWSQPANAAKPIDFTEAGSTTLVMDLPKKLVQGIDAAAKLLSAPKVAVSSLQYAAMVTSDKSISESASKLSAMNLKSRASIVPVTFREVIEWSVSSDSSLPGCDSTVVTAHDVRLIMWRWPLISFSA